MTDDLDHSDEDGKNESKNCGIFIFRRDFRIEDNNGLNWMSFSCKNIHPVFIFTPEQVGAGNDYKSNNAVLFMIESLLDLQKRIREKGGTLHCFYGKNKSVLQQLIRAWGVDYVCFNRDYTPYAKKRDAEIFSLCRSMKILCESAPDYYLHEPDTIHSGSGDTYKKFTPYYDTARKVRVQGVYRYPISFAKSASGTLSSKITLEQALAKFTRPNSDLLVRGGRKEAQAALRDAKQRLRTYSSSRDDMAKETSQLSAYIKFGCLSVREIYRECKSNAAFTRQLMWRDFYMDILNAYPQVLGKALKPKYNKIKWRFNQRWFQAWCDGKTGFPLVDAAMRQMNTTGYMHNRGRLVVASFLTKTLLISWRRGEQYFATKLTDYDPASNNGNWQWVASTGADSQPYFRIFSPTEQLKKHDPHATYVRSWVKELKDVPVRDIMHWDTKYKEYKSTGYPGPIVEFNKQRTLALEMFSSAVGGD